MVMVMRYSSMALLLVASFALAACGDDSVPAGSSSADGGHTQQDAGTDTGSGQLVRSMTVTPEEITQDGASSVDWQVSMIVVGLEGELVDVDVFAGLGGADRTANHETFEADEDVVTLVGVNEAWMAGLVPGEYPIGVGLRTDTGEDYTYRAVTTVTVTE